jgi:hypothetical protein
MTNFLNKNQFTLKNTPNEYSTHDLNSTPFFKGEDVPFELGQQLISLCKLVFNYKITTTENKNSQADHTIYYIILL